MKRVQLFFSVVLLFLFACQNQEQGRDITSSGNIHTGTWRGILKPNNIEIPFIFHVDQEGNGIAIQLVNAEERIPLDEVIIENDSIHITMYIFDASIHASIEDGKFMKGIYVKDYLEDYVIPFEATFGETARFLTKSNEVTSSFDGKWEVDFITEEGIEKAIGMFKQNDKSVTGTFILSSGDYRFLDGVVNGDTMKISCFDGTHLYLFEARMLPDGEIEGDFWSGKSWHQQWRATRNADFELPDPSTLAFMKEGYDTFEIEFPSTSGDLVSLSDDRYQDKIVVVQVLGTWCPNCMDETRFYADWYRKNKGRGVEILGLAFERKADFSYAVERVNKMKDKLGVDYEVLVAGTNSLESRAAALPMIKGAISFPTSIILDREHKVRKIHSGFAGPGTGIYYERFAEEFKLFMDKLISE